MTPEQQAYGCPYIAATACSDCDGSCWGSLEIQPQPTAEEYCAAGGHEPYGEQDGISVCYCGAVVGGAQ